MKSYNHLFERCITDECIELAIKNASRGFKRKRRREVRKALKDIEALKASVRRYLMNFENARHVPRVIYDGIERKQRTIIVPTFMELIAQHAVCIVLIPILMKGMYEHTYASIPGRGATLGKWHIEHHIRRGRHIKYYLKLDVRKYFESVSHDRLKAKLSKLIRDKKFLSILFTMIDVTPKGIPIGFYTSQWFANFYLTDFDHWVKEVLKAPAYYRYMDDMVIFADNKRELHRMKRRIEERLEVVESLALKGNWQVVRFHYVKPDGSEIGRDLDFMGFRFYRNRTTIRKSILQKSRRKANRISKKARPTIHDCRQMTSYIGWYGRTDTHGYWMRNIASKIDIEWMKAYISRFDRRMNDARKMA